MNRYYPNIDMGPFIQKKHNKYCDVFRFGKWDIDVWRSRGLGYAATVFYDNDRVGHASTPEEVEQWVSRAVASEGGPS
jgi:hypothetical protein